VEEFFLGDFRLSYPIFLDASSFFLGRFGGPNTKSAPNGQGLLQLKRTLRSMAEGSSGGPQAKLSGGGAGILKLEGYPVAGSMLPGTEGAGGLTNLGRRARSVRKYPAEGIPKLARLPSSEDSQNASGGSP